MSSISELEAEVLIKLEQQNHSPSTTYGYTHVYGQFKAFCVNAGTDQFSKEICSLFLQSVRNQTPTLDRSKLLLYERALRRLECVSENIEWKPNYHPVIPYQHSRFDDLLNQYSVYLMQKPITTEYYRSQLHNIAKFLRRLEGCGLESITAIRAEHIVSVFCDVKYSIRHRRDVCAFLKYAYVYGLISCDLTEVIPMPNRHYPIPSVYSPLEVEQMLATIDRSKKTGKRNYAVLLLAARLGLRASDIATLTFENLKAETIDFVQQKTKRPHSLPFLPEVKDAVEDYVNNARPVSSQNVVFLDKGGYNAISAKSIGSIARIAFKKAGIDCKGRRMGSHSLRSSLASALVSEGNSYFTVQKVLDHINIQTTKSYVKADCDQLKKCALSVPAPTGNFKAILEQGRTNA